MTELPFTTVIDGNESGALHSPTRKMALSFATPSARVGKDVQIYHNVDGSRVIDTEAMNLLAKRVNRTAPAGTSETGSASVYNALIALSHKSGLLAKTAIKGPVSEADAESLLASMNEVSAVLEMA